MKKQPTAKDTQKPTTYNYIGDGHKRFCKRCKGHNDGCPITGTDKPAASCNL